jgi:pimeloyl-ACP methyl ester carboxylesterase
MLSARAHDDSVIDVQVHGSGPAILMHPQYAYPGAPPEAWSAISALREALIKRLADRYRLVMFDYPHGPWPHTLTAENVVADLLAIADAAEVERFAWCGYSWTGVIGLQLALDNARMNGLICGGWPPIHGPYEGMLRAIQAAQVGEGPDVLNEAPVQVLQQFATFYTGLQGFDDVAAQERITCPRLCFAGSADNIYDLGIGRTVIDRRERLEELGWDVRVIDGLDHGALLQPDALIPLIADWLDEHREDIRGTEREGTVG